MEAKQDKTASEAENQNPIPPGGSSAAPGDTFADTQTFLQRAARQLQWWSESDERGKVYRADLEQRAERDMRYKDRLYGCPVSEQVDQAVDIFNAEADSMDMKKLLRMEFEVSFGPDAIAARYLKWGHASLGTDEPNPLPAWIDKMTAQIHERYARHLSFNMALVAEPQIYILVTLYVTTLLAWIDEFRNMLPFAAAYLTGGQRPRVQLARCLADHHDELLLSSDMMDIIQQDYLHDKILPDDWRRLLDPRQLPGFPQGVLAEDGRASTNRHDSAARYEQSRARVEALLENARASADLTRCHDLLLTFLRARRTILRVQRSWAQLTNLVGNSAQHDRDGAEAGETDDAKRARTRTPRRSIKRRTQPTGDHTS